MLPAASGACDVSVVVMLVAMLLVRVLVVVMSAVMAQRSGWKYFVFGIHVRSQKAAAMASEKIVLFLFLFLLQWDLSGFGFLPMRTPPCAQITMTSSI